MSEPRLSVVIPVYNNEATLDELLDRLTRVLEEVEPAFEIITVDDGSRDGSLALLQRRSLRDPRLRPLALTRNFGGQSAWCAGFDAVRGARTVCLDADLENLPEDVPHLLAALDAGSDFACGVRIGRKAPLFGRRLPSALMNAYVRNRTGIRIRDLGCAMRAMESRLVRDLASEGESRRFLTPILIERASRPVEVPVRYQPSPARGGHSFFSLLVIAGDFLLATAGRPFQVTGLFCAFLLAAGMLTLGWGLAAGRTSAALAGVVLATGGTLGIIVSLVGEYVQRVYEFAQGRPYYQLRELPPLPKEETAAASAAGPDDDVPRPPVH